MYSHVGAIEIGAADEMIKSPFKLIGEAYIMEIDVIDRMSIGVVSIGGSEGNPRLLLIEVTTVSSEHGIFLVVPMSTLLFSMAVLLGLAVLGQNLDLVEESWYRYWRRSALRAIDKLTGNAKKQKVR